MTDPSPPVVTVTTSPMTSVASSQAISNPITSATITTEIHPNGRVSKTVIQTTKPFYSTSEFWKSLIVVVIGLVGYIHPGWHNPVPDQQAGILAAALASAGYAISRSISKKATN